MARPKKLSSRDALLKVLGENDGATMTVKDLVDAALPLTDLKGKTPRATLSHVLYVNPKLFEKVGKGSFKLAPKAPVETPVALDAELQAQAAQTVEKPIEKKKKNRARRAKQTA